MLLSSAPFLNFQIGTSSKMVSCSQKSSLSIHFFSSAKTLSISGISPIDELIIVPVRNIILHLYSSACFAIYATANPYVFNPIEE